MVQHIETSHAEASARDDRRRSLPTALTGLSARLLVLTIVFVMLSEVAIYVPSIARFRMTYLEEKISSAHLASLALKAAPDYMVDEALKAELLDSAGVHAVVLKLQDRRLMLLQGDMPPKVDANFELRGMMATDMIVDAFGTLTGPERMIRVIGPVAGRPDESIELVMEEGPLRRAMVDYSINILSLSIVISLITAGLVYLSLQALLVRPMRRITGAMVTFRKAPEADASVIQPSARADELGLAEAELAAMQEDLRGALRQKTRLAALGAAMSKVNHDLRNILATAQLVSERLGSSADPEVRRVTPTLLASIDRAIDLCTQTLAYGKAEEPAPQRRRFRLRELVEDVRLSVGLPTDGSIAWADDVAQWDADDPGPGYTCFGSPGTWTADTLAGWAPGQQPSVYPEGVGVYLEPGDVIVNQIHYHYDHETPADDSTIVLQTATAEEVAAGMVRIRGSAYTTPAEMPCTPEEIATGAPLCDRNAVLRELAELYGPTAAFLPDVMIRGCGGTLSDYDQLDGTVAHSSCDLEARNTGTIFSVLGHMHEFGAAYRMTLHPDTSDELVLLAIPTWSFEWQLAYEPIEQIRIERGDTVRFECWWDRSLVHLDEPRYVTWNEGTVDEMCYSSIQVVPDE